MEDKMNEQEPNQDEELKEDQSTTEEEKMEESAEVEHQEQEDREERSKNGSSQAVDQSESEEEEPTEVEELNKEVEELKDKYLRLYAEFENYKKRTLKERVELRKTAARDVVNALLPVLDDFDRAKQSAEDESTEEVFSEGVELVYNKLYKTLKEQGLEPMKTNGEAFNSDLHEAVSEVPASSDDMKGKIIDTIEKGYFLNDRIIRHAKVVVGK